MQILQNIPLAQYTTFKIGGPARFFCHVKNEDELIEAVKYAKAHNLPTFVLGGGSNLLVSDHGYSGLVIKMEILGKDFSNADSSSSDEVIVSAGAGELWDAFISDCVERNLYGIENLSAIPGTVGAAPVQNLGAYGIDVSEAIFSVRVLNTQSLQFTDFSNAECKFEYRDSLFKHMKGRYIVTKVNFKLLRNGKVNIGYKDLQEYFAKKTIGRDYIPSLGEVREAVIDIRWNKLPDWKMWGTAGSFFKNPVISAEKFKELKTKYPDLPGFPDKDGKFKVSLAWILDKVCKAKGYSSGTVKTFEKQALVVVAQPGSSAENVVNLTHDLMKLVKEATGIEIEAEVEWVN